MDGHGRVDDFVLDINTPGFKIPDPGKDFGMYRALEKAFEGVHGELENLRRNQGRLGYVSQNLMSDLSKAYIELVQLGDEDLAAYIARDMQNLASGFDNAADNQQIAESGSRFSRTMWQEKLEAELFGIIWPVVVGREQVVSELPSRENFEGNVQAYLYGFLDVVSELGKAVTDELSNPGITTQQEFSVFERYLVIADSLLLVLSQERHAPGYVINNGYGRWMAYTNKLRTAYGTVAHIRRDYNLRLSIRRMIEDRD